jgi:hypothetical protein
LILKEYYLEATRDLLNSKRILSRVLRRNSEDVSGRQVVISLNTQRNEGMGFVADGAQLPDPRSQTYDQARYDTRYDYLRILFTGPSVASSRNDRGAFLRIMDAEIRGGARDLQHESNRVMFGDGTGRLCQLSGVAGAPTYNVDNPGGIVSTGLGTQYMRVGMRVCLFDSEVPNVHAADANFRVTGAGNRGATVTAVDYVAGTITLDNAIVAAADNDFVYRIAEISSTIADESSSRGNEPFGLAAIIADVDPPLADGAHGLTQGLGEIVATAPQWAAFVLDNGGVAIPFSQDMLQQASDGVDIQGDGTVGMWMTTHGIRRQYLNSLVANKRYPGMMKLDGGFSAVEYNGRPMVVDKDCTRGRIYGLDLDTIEIYYETDYQWMDADGSILHRLPDHDAYQATLYRYWQMGSWARNRNCAIHDIQDT